MTATGEERSGMSAAGWWNGLTPDERTARWIAYIENPVLAIREHFYIVVDDQPTLFGNVITDWQLDFFEAVFSRHPDGTPKHRVVYSERRRGESKTEDMAIAALADLLFGPRFSKSYVVATDKDQAAVVRESVERLQACTPLLAKLVVTRSIITNPATGSTVTILAADERTNWGLRARRIFFDELSLQVDAKLWTVMISTLGKSKRAQMVACSMAGHDFASIGWKVRKTALEDPAYFFQSREGTELAPWLSAKDMEEQKVWLLPADFARLWLCRWTEVDGSWITREMYELAEIGEESLGDKVHRHVIYVDLGLVHDLTAIAVARAEDDGTVILSSLHTMKGTRAEPVNLEAVENLVADLVERFNVRAVTFEAWQAVGSVQRLQKRLPGVKVDALSPTQGTQATLFQTLLTLFATNQLVLFPHEQLRKEALGLLVKLSGGQAKVVGTNAVHQDHVVAVGGAANLLIHGAQKKERSNLDLLGGINSGMVRSGPKPEPFGFGTTGRGMTTWSGGIDQSVDPGYQGISGSEGASNQQYVRPASAYDPVWEWAKLHGWSTNDKDQCERRFAGLGLTPAEVIARLDEVSKGKTFGDRKLQTLVDLTFGDLP